MARLHCPGGLSEYFRVINTNLRRYAAPLPIAHALNGTRLIKEFQALSYSGRTAKGVNQSCMGVLIWGHRFSGFPQLNNMFNNWVNTACINSPFTRCTIAP
ncbi:hypothetical protein RVU96_16855 [Bordetella avium]|uniref:hypothetical protein n=1 Tax=Bordetella avium TaxID=521 RepID=UPI000E16CE3E|nr:hypothetical protein [Bordetella avium]WQE34833.1 hypothetical protein U0029_06755 [Bordetella avium]SUV68482.1 Uncharacterised protein [Bordetella avium]